MTSDRRVSVIIPAYNAASTLRRCLDSVFANDSRPAEVIVVDDGSTDDTAAVAVSYGERVRYVAQENQGPSAARNRGLSLAEGEFIAFLDADDYWLSGFLRRCTEFLDEHPRAIAVSTGQLIKLWGKKDRVYPPVLHAQRDGEQTLQPVVLEDFFRFWAEQNHITTGSNVIRRTVIDRAGCQRTDLRISEDLEYWGYLATYGNWGFIPEVHWVGDPTPCAAAQGARRKQSKRRELCPTVEAWQSRILPRLQSKDFDAFRVVRGRVAGGLAYAKVLGGAPCAAREIAIRYGREFEPGAIARLLAFSSRAGAIPWHLCCAFLKSRELLKGLLMSYGAPRVTG